MLWNPQVLIIHTHKDGENLSFCESMSYPFRLHMLIDHGELITEIYMGFGQIGQESAMRVGCITYKF